MGESTDKMAFKVLRYGLMSGLITGASTLFLLFLLSILLITQYDPIDPEFYIGYCFRVPLVASLLGTMVGAILALITKSRKKLLKYISITAMVIGIIASLDWSKFTPFLEGYLTNEILSNIQD